jgi:hypothetical protein
MFFVYLAPKKRLFEICKAPPGCRFLKHDF